MCVSINVGNHKVGLIVQLAIGSLLVVVVVIGIAFIIKARNKYKVHQRLHYLETTLEMSSLMNRRYRKREDCQPSSLVSRYVLKLLINVKSSG